VNLVVWQQLLVRSAQQWADRADELYAARASLQEAPTDRLGPRVGPVAEAFAAHWAARIGTLCEEAQQHSSALSGAAFDFGQTDEDTVARFQQLVPWADRDAGPRSGG
jgi:hypothetical protein